MPKPTQTQRRRTFIDLFAGCGGMSLGLEQAGYMPIMVNELNPDALATYLGNRTEFPDLNRFRTNDIFELTGKDHRDTLASLRADLLRHYGIQDVDLLVGGPPCQGFSGLGIRRTFNDLRRWDVPSNHLYREMATVIAAVRPRAFVFENVKGLKSSRWTPEGEKGEIWEDVLASFQSIDGYEALPAEVEARSYGVPQHRPRVLIVGVRRDVASATAAGNAGGLLPEATGGAPDPVDFLGDLVDPNYPTALTTVAYPSAPTTEAQIRYRTDKLGEAVSMRGDPLTDHEYSHHHPRIAAKFEYMIASGGMVRDADRTRKFAQRLLPARWGERGPTITATSMPDDYVHFSQPRTLTVREWARLQTFPDWYQFVGKRTTGGRRRAGDPSARLWTRDLPKYTQIGNAVPVALARAIGEHLKNVTD